MYIYQETNTLLKSEKTNTNILKTNTLLGSGIFTNGGVTQNGGVFLKWGWGVLTSLLTMYNRIYKERKLKDKKQNTICKKNCLKAGGRVISHDDLVVYP